MWCIILFRLHCAVCNWTIDIPSQFANPEKYNGTLGHKINHDFEPNTKFVGVYDSAR